MSAKAPLPGAQTENTLRHLGRQIRAQRKALKVCQRLVWLRLLKNFNHRVVFLAVVRQSF